MKRALQPLQNSIKLIQYNTFQWPWIVTYYYMLTLKDQVVQPSLSPSLSLPPSHSQSHHFQPVARKRTVYNLVVAISFLTLLYVDLCFNVLCVVFIAGAVHWVHSKNTNFPTRLAVVLLHRLRQASSHDTFLIFNNVAVNTLCRSHVTHWCSSSHYHCHHEYHLDEASVNLGICWKWCVYKWVLTYAARFWNCRFLFGKCYYLIWLVVVFKEKGVLIK